MTKALIRRGFAVLALTVVAGVAAACGSNDLTAPGGDDSEPICYPVGGTIICGS